MMEPGDSSKDTRAWLASTYLRTRDLLEEGAMRFNEWREKRRLNNRFVKVRDRPKGTKLVRFGDGTVKLRFKSALRFWWRMSWLLWPLFIGAIIGGFALAASTTFYGLVENARQNYTFGQSINIGGMIVASIFAGIGGAIGWTILVSPIAWLIMALTRPWVTIFADKDKIVVGRQTFDRQHYSGLRLGYEIQTPDAQLKNDFHDLDIGLQGLRLVYGPWGEDLPYLVNKYHANEIVLWINLQINATAPAPVTTAQSGDREQRFE